MAMDNCTDNFSDAVTTPGDVYTSIVETGILTISFVLNVIIVACVCCSPHLHTFSNVFVVSLAVSDILFATAYEFTSAVNLYMASTHLPSPCSPVLQCMSSYLASCSMICSRICHLVVSVERWLYIAWPFVHQRVITTKSIINCLICVWIISMLSGVHIITDCRSSYTEFMIGYATIDACVHFVVGSLMVAIYVHIGFIIRQQSVAILKSRPTVGNNNVGTINSRIAWNIVRMPVTIFGTFFLCVTPIVFCNIYLFATDESPTFYHGNTMYDVLRIITIFHTWANFLVYVLQDKKFRSVMACYLLKMGTVIWPIRIHPINN
ncbi:unnamed protein product [Candidula unifasciata]|uniref:G-protein coupled receptors family 1 profile domain-containing protein n=1 Tax=Candidula unifasciata TaxID=100452 RepID=A0A8S3ZNL8_9EUPU|nr:unnamed protein product [Candidula unifasciata]